MTIFTEEAARRRTFAVIMHLDVGRSILTKTLALHAHIINEVDAVHDKAGRRSTVSDWIDIEKDRGILITSSALQFKYQPEGHNGEPHMINLVDTPGHADFSEDTYRVLTAVGATVMFVNGAKDLESQTLKLFRVCKSDGIPIATVINKQGRLGKVPLELVDETVAEIGLQPVLLYWPVGKTGDLRGLLERDEDGEVKQFIGFEHTVGGATIAAECHLTPDEAAAEQGDAWGTMAGESGLLFTGGVDHDQEMYLAGDTFPVIFASVMLDWGVHQILDTLYELAPTPGARESDPAAVATAAAGGQGAIVEKREPTDDFSGVVFKVQMGTGTHHRDKLAFMHVVSGESDCGMQATHTQSGRSFSIRYALAIFNRTRSTVETAYPGGIAGLINMGSLAPGDTTYEGRKVQFKPVPQFAPERFRTLRAKSLSKYKQFRKTVDQLDAGGVVQTPRNDARSDTTPVMAAVGPMQLKVVMACMENKYNVEAIVKPILCSVARHTDEKTAPELVKQCGVEIFTRFDGALIAPFGDKWKLSFIEKEHPEFTLETLVTD